MGAASALFVLSLLPLAYLLYFPTPTTAFIWRYERHALNTGLPRARYRWVDRQDMSSQLPLAAMASEDQRFPSHDGLDATELRNAVADNLKGKPLRGASTITQQLAKNLFLWPGRSLARKAVELYYATALESLWPKARILEMYLNIAEFGPGLYGVQAASTHYFGLDPGALTADQAAWLMTQLPAPSTFDLRHPSPRQRLKQRWVRKQMSILRGMGHLDAVGWTDLHLQAGRSASGRATQSSSRPMSAK